MFARSDRLTLRQLLQVIALGAIVGAVRGVFDVVLGEKHGWGGVVPLWAWMIGGRAFNGAIGTGLGITIADRLSRSQRPSRRAWGLFLGACFGFSSSQLEEPRYATGDAISGLVFTMIAVVVGGVGATLTAQLFPEREEPRAKADP